VSNNTICTYFNGNIIEGERNNGEFTGPCKKTYADGDYMFHAGDVLEGEFKNDEFIGPCKQTYGDGNVLEGEYKNDEFIGPCKLTYEDDGTVLEGEKKNGVFTGLCKLTYADDGTVLEGERKNGDWNGLCKYTFKNENPLKYIPKRYKYEETILEGEMKNGEWNGQFKRTVQTVGIYREVYEGEKKNGEWIGQIKYTYVHEHHKINQVADCEIKKGFMKFKFKYHIGIPVFQYDKKCNLIKRFDSIKSCAKSLKTCRHQITNRLKNIKCRDPARYPANYYLNQHVFTTTII
jgi:hypothetical protein